MKEWQIRVLEERKLLDDKILRMISFIASDEFAELHLDERTLLSLQLEIMRIYSGILSDRITLFVH